MVRRSKIVLVVLVLLSACDRRKSEAPPLDIVPVAVEIDAAPPRIEVVTEAPPDFGPTDAGVVSVEGPSPEPLAVDVRNASELVIYDTWNGMGSTHAAVIAFRKAGSVFTYQAKVTASPRSLGEPVPEPKGCKCAVAASCECESEQRPARKRGQIAARVVADLLTAFGTRPFDLRQNFKGAPHHTDDYPYLHMVVTVPGKKPVHFTAADQRRHWTRDGKYLYRLPDEPTGLRDESEHKKLNAALQSLEKAVGLEAWVAQEHKKHPNTQRL
jgi:hypothetical protein